MQVRQVVEIKEATGNEAPGDMLLLGFKGAFASSRNESERLRSLGFDVRGLSRGGRTIYLKFG